MSQQIELLVLVQAALRNTTDCWLNHQSLIPLGGLHHHDLDLLKFRPPVSSYWWLDSTMWTCGHTRIHSVHSICLRVTEWITVSLVISKLCHLAWGFNLMASVPASPGPNLFIKIYATQSWHGAQLYHRIISHFS